MRVATTSSGKEARSGVAGPLILSFHDRHPRIDPEAWVAPNAVVTGDVVIGPGSSLWFGAVVRGDVHSIRIGARTNLQDHAIVHVTEDQFSTTIGDEVTVGHRAVVHGCRIEDGALIGIGALVLDGAEVGAEALVAAGALVPPGARIPPGALVMGVPARVVRTLDESERKLQRERALTYVETARMYRKRSTP